MDGTGSFLSRFSSFFYVSSSVVFFGVGAAGDILARGEDGGVVANQNLMKRKIFLGIGMQRERSLKMLLKK